MVNIKINNKEVSVKEGSTILEAARVAHIHIPHLCFLKEINEVSACRLCCVEVEGSNKLIPACDNIVYDGMVIHTDTERVRNSVRNNLTLILSQHNSDCTTCVRNGNCQLQNLASDYKMEKNLYMKNNFNKKWQEWNQDFPLIRDQSKCVNCLRCVNICDKVQSMNVWDLLNTGSPSHVGVRGSKKIEDTNCTICSQCVTHCPVGALYERNDIKKVTEALDDKNIITIFQFAPAVRDAWIECFGMSKEEVDSERRLVGILKLLGADYVYDTSFAADLTIMEEASELIKRMTDGKKHKYPMFTSCCPAWVRFAKTEFPELVEDLSTSKSPHEMFGATIKAYFKEKMNIDPTKIRVISIMPCVAKKSEARLKGLVNDSLPNVDYVLTTREIVDLIKARRIHPNRVEDQEYDTLFKDFTGAGVIFGASGGVLEAALRTGYHMITGKEIAADAFEDLRVYDDKGTMREKEIKINDLTLRVAVVSGLGNTRRLLNDIVSGVKQYDFVEVMACPTGCSGGGGQPIYTDDVERGLSRGKILYNRDNDMPIRYSHKNPDIIKLYDEFFGKPLSEKAEEYLHVEHIIEDR